MYGSSTGLLEVSIHSGNKTFSWLKSGEQGRNWVEAKINLRMSQNFIVSLTCFYFYLIKYSNGNLSSFEIGNKIIVHILLTLSHSLYFRNNCE